MMPFGRLKSTVIHSKCVQFLLCLFAIFLVYVYYHSGPTNSFTHENQKIFKSEQFEKRLDEEIKKNYKNEENLLNVESIQRDFQDHENIQEVKDTVIVNDEHHMAVNGGDVKIKGTGSERTTYEKIDVMITFVNAVHNKDLQQKFRQAVSSLLKHATIAMAIHIIGDAASQHLASKILQEYTNADTVEYEVVRRDVDSLAKQLDDIVKPMQHHFSYKTGSYYNHALFFLSIAMHKVFPETTKRVIMFDADVKFLADIRELHAIFSDFTDSNILGIANDLQPVYRHTFWQYRRDNPGTRVGEPPPHGLAGFNSGVLLLDLEKIRRSSLYNSLINADALKNLTGKFKFQGHLGDQDFFTLLGMEYEELFYTLPCNWNRQLCIWWKDKGYQDVFDSYHRCDGPVKIFHGNCNTPIPE